jgi:hypothetical protein
MASDFSEALKIECSIAMAGIAKRDEGTQVVIYRESR